jgi:acyl carrier protein
MIWQAVLNLESVGIHDNFFDLGGHSLRLVQVHNQLCHTFQTHFPLLELFRYPTVSSLAEFLSQFKKQNSHLDEDPGDRLNQLTKGKARLKQVLKLSKS